MKKLAFVFLTLLLLLSCEKEQMMMRSGPIDEFVYDPTGVVFKITNDVSEVLYQAIKQNPTGGGFSYIYPFIEKVDSICMLRFHYFGLLNYNCQEKVWFTKKGQYLCWRDVYIGEINSIKRLSFGIPNRHPELRPDKMILYESTIFTGPGATLYTIFTSKFPTPVNDTVYVKLSSLRPDHFFQ